MQATANISHLFLCQTRLPKQKYSSTSCLWNITIRFVGRYEMTWFYDNLIPLTLGSYFWNSRRKMGMSQPRRSHWVSGKFQYLRTCIVTCVCVIVRIIHYIITSYHIVYLYISIFTCLLILRLRGEFQLSLQCTKSLSLSLSICFIHVCTYVIVYIFAFSVYVCVY